METNVFLIVSVILGVLLLGAIIAVICVAVIPSRSDSTKDIIRFDHYSAEYLTLFSDTSYLYENLLANKSHHSEGRTKIFVFQPGEWYTETYNSSGQVASRSFSVDFQHTSATCQHLLTHDNCYILPTGSYKTFVIPHGAEFLGEHRCNPTNQDTFPFAYPGFFKDFIPDRILGTNENDCKSYSITDGETLIIYTVETKTGHPIMTRIQSNNPAGGNMMIQLYNSFSPEKPTNQEGLKPFPNVVIYDFRHTMGTSNKEKSKDNKSFTGIKEFFQKLFGTPKKDESDVQHLLNSMKTTKKSFENDESDKYIQTIRRNQAIRDFLGLPSMRVPDLKTVSILQTAVRDVRDIPASFDAREYWPDCKEVIGNIKDQQYCGSCWAMAGSGVLADRICIANNESKQELSAQYMVNCLLNNNGCQGGDTLSTWEGLFKYGTVPESCVPFTGHDGGCPTRCVTGEKITEDLKVRPGKYISLPWGKGNSSRVQAIQTEIMTNGPVWAGFWVFSDFKPFFKNNKKGIYDLGYHTTLEGGHAVRIIGWGTEEGVDYWLAVNSWGKEFADNGVFKIRRGKNSCNIEEEVSAGLLA